jgi:hypothetical protein
MILIIARPRREFIASRNKSHGARVRRWTKVYDDRRPCAAGDAT